MPRFETSALFRPVDIASLVYARIVFGLLMLWEVWRYFEHGRILRYWIEPEINFTYPFFPWVTPLPGDGMYWLFIGLAVLSILIVLGLFYRVAAVLFFVGFTYTFLLEQGRYLNHFYLVCLLSFLLMFVPANRSFSLDARFGLAKRSDTTPAWTLWILLFQMSVVYFYGGIAKINADWLAGYPLQDWLSGRSHYPLIGELLAHKSVAIAMASAGMLFDLLIPFFLLWKPTRMTAFVAAVAFHVMNMVLWNIGIFPWLAIAMTALFFEPSWPRRYFRLPEFGFSAPVASRPIQTFAVASLAVYCLLQMLIPLRHYIIPGDVCWTEDGHQFSWRMKLRSRDGRADFHLVETDSGRIHTIDPYDYLIEWQILEMDTSPDMMLQFADILKDDFVSKTGKDVTVHAHSVISINGRPDQVYFSPGIDLAEVPRVGIRDNWLNEFNDSRDVESFDDSLVLD